MRFASGLGVIVTTFFALLASQAPGQESIGPWIATVKILRDGQQTGSGVYLQSGLIITAAHLTDVSAKMGVHIAGAELAATVLKQGSIEDVDLSLLSIDEQKLPARPVLPKMQLCEAPPWPGDPVIVVDERAATRSHIISPQVLPFSLRSKFPTLIGDVATTGLSGSGVFNPDRKCLLGIMSQKITARTLKGDIDLAKYLVPAAAIRDFMPADLRGPGYRR